MKLKNSNGRKNITFSIDEEILNEFYHLLIEKFGCTRNHVGKSIDGAVKLWIDKNKKKSINNK